LGFGFQNKFSPFVINLCILYSLLAFGLRLLKVLLVSQQIERSLVIVVRTTSLFLLLCLLPQPIFFKPKGHIKLGVQGVLLLLKLLFETF
jgi:hypothetical protein